MSIEFFLGLIVVICGMAALAWVYCAIFDFVDKMKKSAKWRFGLRLQEERDRREAAHIPLNEYCAATEIPRTRLKQLVMEADARECEARLPPMGALKIHLFDYDPPKGPPDGWERHPIKPRGA